MIMASFYIHSLFTNIPFDETISICVESVFANKRKIKGFSKNRLLKTFNFIGIYLYNIYTNKRNVRETKRNARAFAELKIIDVIQEENEPLQVE